MFLPIQPATSTSLGNSEKTDVLMHLLRWNMPSAYLTALITDALKQSCVCAPTLTQELPSYSQEPDDNASSYSAILDVRGTLTPEWLEKEQAESNIPEWERPSEGNLRLLQLHFCYKRSVLAGPDADTLGIEAYLGSLTPNPALAEAEVFPNQRAQWQNHLTLEGTNFCTIPFFMKCALAVFEDIQ